VPVKYSSDYRLARDIFQRILSDIIGEYTQQARMSWETLIRQYCVEPAELDPRVFLVANDNWMEFTLRYVVDYKKRRITKDFLFTRVLEDVERTSGRVFLASTTFHLVGTPESRSNSSRRRKAPCRELRYTYPSHRIGDCLYTNQPRVWRSSESHTSQMAASIIRIHLARSERFIATVMPQIDGRRELTKTARAVHEGRGAISSSWNPPPVSRTGALPHHSRTCL